MNLAWADGLDGNQQAELRADLEATEMCACGHRDDEHDANSQCAHSRYGRHACFAYNPIQR